MLHSRGASAISSEQQLRGLRRLRRLRARWLIAAVVAVQGAALAALGAPAAGADTPVYTALFDLEYAHDIALGPDGSVYIAGVYGAASDPDLATPGAYDETPNGGEDAVVARIDPTGRVVYATFLGGSTSDDAASSIAVDEAGAAYVVGITDSTGNFPTTPGALDDSYSSNRSEYVGFAAKISPDGSTLDYSTRIPGTRVASRVGVDQQGRAHIVGEPFPDFMPTPGAFDPSCTNCDNFADMFVATLDPTGSRMPQATFLGGSLDESAAPDLEVDDTGNTYVTGSTTSDDFPVTSNAYDTTFNGRPGDAVVTKFDPSGHALFSTFVGGALLDSPGGLAVRPDGGIYLMGRTTSGNFPTTPGALFPQKPRAEGEDGWLLSLDPTGSALDFSTYLPARMMALDSDGEGDVHVATEQATSAFPVTDGAAGSEVLAEFDHNGSLLDSSAIGVFTGAMVVDSAGSRYIFGSKATAPATASASTASGGSDRSAALAAPAPTAGRFAVTRLSRCTIVGTRNADVLTGTRGPDVICAGEGDDTVRSAGAFDIVRLGPGDDSAWAGPGIDVVVGGPGADRVFGLGSRDLLRGGPGADVLAGDAGSDSVFGALGSDRVLGGGGSDELSGGAGNDLVSGGAHADRLSGGRASDRLLGGEQPDRLYGNRGPDMLNGGLARDMCRGQSGRDTTRRCEL